MKSICVFCGANVGARPAYADAAQQFGSLLAERGLELVYGGGRVGLMGTLADAALAGGARVTGVIPEALATKELAHSELYELRVVASMHERKATMAELSDAFVALPGGFGTMEEFFEVLTWAQLGFHHKPLALLSVEGFYDPLLRFFDHLVAEGFVQQRFRDLVLVEPTAQAMLDRLAVYQAPRVRRWLDQDEL